MTGGYVDTTLAPSAGYPPSAVPLPCVETSQQFANWLATAAAGDRCIYYRGHLNVCAGLRAHSAFAVRISGLVHTGCGDARCAACAAMTAYLGGSVHLVQRRDMFDNFEYIAEKRPVPGRPR